MVAPEDEGEDTGGGRSGVGVHVVVATTLIPESVVEQMATVMPDGVTVSRVPVPWDDRFGQVAIESSWVEALGRSHVLVGFPQQITGLIEAAPDLRWVQYYGAGYERAPLEALRAAGVGLVSAAGAGADGVAEFAVMAMLSLARRMPERVVAQQQRRWERFPTRELAGRRVTILGAGEIGSRLCRISASLGLDVTSVRRRPEAGCPPGARRVVGPDDLLDVLVESDVVVLAAALTDDTEPLGTTAFAALPPGALLVNVGRGGLIDHDALGVALSDGALAGAWLDVLPEEPLPESHPLWVTPHLVISAHDATATASYPWNVAKMTAAHVRQWLDGESITHTVLPLGPPPASTVDER
jgi:phosphoglycerate dehydrogenase-like enzyme